MPTTEASPCPKCAGATDTRHCEKPGCPWWRCLVDKTVFDRAGRINEVLSQ